MPDLLKRIRKMFQTKEEPKQKPAVPESILWLQEKGVAKNKAETFWHHLTHPHEAPADADIDFKDARARLEVIYSDGDKIANSKPDNAHIFTEEEFPGYTKEGSILHFVNTEICIQRYQKSKLCYLHAVTMVQYYAICFFCVKNGLPIQHSVLNIGFYIKKNFNPKRLERHIIYNNGGNSFLELKMILEQDSKYNHVYFDTEEDVVPLIITNLRKYGPALVSNFNVQDDFGNVHKRKHYGTITREPNDNGHAMVLVGYREEDGKHYFLLQNWWLEKQFVEVDIDYLSSCSPSLHWVTTEQKGIPKELPTNFGTWLETEAAEFLDGYDLEDGDE